MVIVQKTFHKKIVSPLKDFIEDSRASGIMLIGCTLFSLWMSNMDWGKSYVAFWNQPHFTHFSLFHFPESWIHVINDGLMSLFFLLVGLEIKRELITGELSQLKKALLPILAAIGGMIIPALVFLVFCGGSTYANGWGIPIATDIAFSLAILSLLGNKVPVSLKIFLMALAIIDDLGGIVTIAIFYATAIHWSYILLSIALVLVNFFLQHLKVQHLLLHFISGLLLWYFLYNSGIHASIAGVITALLLPITQTAILEHKLHIPVNFIIMPLFALANTAMVFPEKISIVFQSKIAWGILLGLVVGKPLGILSFSWFSVRLKLAILPHHIRWQHLTGVGIVAGIGFTISIFITSLAYSGNEQQTIAKMAILIASFISAIVGYLFLRKK